MKTKDVAVIKSNVKIKNVPSSVLHKNTKNDLKNQ